MKRLSSIFLLLCLAASAHAQWGISANLSYGNKGNQFTQSGLDSYDGDKPVGQELSFAPRLGFSINGAVELGADLSISNSIYQYTQGYYNPVSAAYEVLSENTQTLFTYGAGGYLRVRLNKWGKLSLHLEGAAGYQQGLGVTTLVEKRSQTSYNQSQNVTQMKAQQVKKIYVSVTPVFNYSLGNHLSMDAYLNFASLTYNLIHTANYRDYYRGQGLDERYLISEETTQDFDIGLHALTTSLVTLGFSYIF